MQIQDTGTKTITAADGGVVRLKEDPSGFMLLQLKQSGDVAFKEVKFAKAEAQFLPQAFSKWIENKLTERA